MATAATDNTRDDAQAYLPDFCAASTILIVLVVAELVAIVLTLAAQAEPGTFLTSLAIVSLYVLWLALLSCALLCRTRQWIERTGKTRGFVSAYVLLVLLCLALAEIAWQVTLRFGEATVIADSHGHFLFRNFAISAIVLALAMRYLYVSSEWRRSIVQEAQARISALQALIRPHFLFNTMNTIASLVRSAPDSAEQAVEDLSDLLRANLASTSSRVTIADELEVAHIYERIEKLRLGDRLRVRWLTEELPRQALIPSLTLQPLLENAIYHGIEQLPQGGEVTVIGSQVNQRLRIVIENPRPVQNQRASGHRMALENIRQRFELAYAGEAEVNINEQEDAYRVTLSFPLQERD